MTYQLLSLNDAPEELSPYFLEGVVLAANFATQPLAPETWLNQVFPDGSEVQTPVEKHINAQYGLLKRNEYSLLSLVEGGEQRENLADVAEGFMTLWPTIETQWQNIVVNDGTGRMLQALLTTFMLLIDEQQTQAQMIEAGIDTPPSASDLLNQLDIMISEVAQAADEAMVGAKSQSVNPYKSTGRNDSCPCGSGRKFKQCCGQ